MNTPKLSFNAGAYAWIIICTILTKVAMITIYTGICTSSGMILRKIEIITLDMINTKITAIPIPMALSTEVVMAKVEQIPKNKENTGFSLKSPFLKL